MAVQEDRSCAECHTPFDAFRTVTEYLGPELFRRASWQGIWTNLIQRDEYERGAGLTLSTFTIGRSEPTADEETWPKIAFTSGAAGTCCTTWNDVDYGHCETTYHPEQIGLRGPIICQDDLIYNWNTEAFLEGYLQALQKRSARTIENRYANLYAHFVPKSIADETYPTYPAPGTDPPAGTLDLGDMIEATCELTQEMLDHTAAELIEDGATNPNSDGWISLGPQGPLFPLYIGLEASNRILTNNADLREDARNAWAGAGDANPLFLRLGASRVIKNFRHIPNLFPPRYVYNAATLTYDRINTWVMSDCSKGHVAEINPQWKTGPFEGAFVLSPWVFRSEVIRPVNTAAGLSWEPKNYFGEWQWVTGGSKIDEDEDCYDPTEKFGRHFGEYKHAPRPIFPDYGRLIIFRRCPTTTFECPTCVS